MEQVSKDSSKISVSESLKRAAEVLGTDVEKAATIASEMLDEYPGQQQGLLLLVSALRLMNADAGAREVLEWMAGEFPKLASIQYELGLLLGRAGEHQAAGECLSRVVALEPLHPTAWRALANERARSGDSAGAAQAYARHVQLSVREIKLIEDSMNGGSEELAKTEKMLRQSLEINPTDVTAIQLLGRVLLQFERHHEATVLLERAIALASDFAAAREDYIAALTNKLDWQRSIEQIDILLKDPRINTARFQALKGVNLVMMGETEQGLWQFEQIREKMAGEVVFWVNYGHALRTAGKSSEAVEAYRRCLEIDPGHGTAWWSLANLKTYRFSPAEVQTMQEQRKRDDMGDGQRCHLEFALGQAMENEKSYAQSFEHYQQANALRRPYVTYNADEATKEMKGAKAFFSPEFFHARAGFGCPSPDPIFIVGLPRAGSTLVEQILSSHSLVEGTMELPDMVDIVAELRRKGRGKDYPGLLSDLDSMAFRKLGEQYLERTRIQRKLGRPFFTDKSGNNFAFTGLIQVILPNAKIIDARRHPLGCCFSGFKQAFPAGSVVHSYELSEIARYYRDYVEMMAHFDRMLPGRVHRLFHEEIVRNPETEIRRLLDFCGLPFEEQCLRFYETERSVRTSSSEQVRKPIDKKAGEAWQNYEPWLGPMKDALGDVLTLYPNVPEFK